MCGISVRFSYADQSIHKNGMTERKKKPVENISGRTVFSFLNAINVGERKNKTKMFKIAVNEKGIAGKRRKT